MQKQKERDEIERAEAEAKRVADEEAAVERAETQARCVDELPKLEFLLDRPGVVAVRTVARGDRQGSSVGMAGG